MKVNDYWRLAKISLKARKKATRSTVSGMSISLIIIVPIIFAMVALYASILPQLNKNPETLYAIFQSGQKGVVTTSYNNYTYQSINGGRYVNTVNAKDNSAVFENASFETLHYVKAYKRFDVYSMDDETLQSEYKYFDRITVDGETKPLRVKSTDNRSASANTSLAVVDSNQLDLLAASKFGVLGDSHNKGFSGNGARQVILSRKYLKMAGLTADDVYGKKVSVEIREKSNGTIDYCSGEDKFSYIDHYLFRDFEVVGVIGSENAPLYDYDGTKDINTADMIVSSASLYSQDNTPAIMYNINADNNNGNYTRYKIDFGNIEAKNFKAYQYLFTGFEDYGIYTNLAKYNDKTGEILQVESNYYKYIPDKNKLNAYGQVSNVVSSVYPHYKADYTLKMEFENVVGSPSYATFSMINFIITIAMSFAAVFAGIILFAALVNLFNTIMHSVNSRKNYLGVMRAIGARSSVIPKLYVSEVMRVFARAFVWIALIGGAICVGIKLLFDYLFKGGLAYGNVVISISWATIPIALVVVITVLAVIGLAFALGCSLKMSRKPIMETLEG